LVLIPAREVDACFPLDATDLDPKGAGVVRPGEHECALARKVAEVVDD